METFQEGSMARSQTIELPPLGGTSCNQIKEIDYPIEDDSTHRASGIRKSFYVSMSTFWKMVNEDTPTRHSGYVRKNKRETEQKSNSKNDIQTLSEGKNEEKSNHTPGSPILDFFNFFDASIHLETTTTAKVKEEDDDSIWEFQCDNPFKDLNKNSLIENYRERADTSTSSIIFMKTGAKQSMEPTDNNEEYTSKCKPIWVFMDWFLRTRIGRVLFRFVPIITTIWSLTDVAFDALQAKEYHEYATIGIRNCSNHLTMSKNIAGDNRTIEVLQVNKISMNYFIVSISTFVYPPILGIILYYLKYGRYGIFGDPNKIHFYKYKERLEACPLIVRLISIFLIIPTISYVRACIGYYVLLPYFSLYFSGKLMWYGKINSQEKVTFHGMEMYFTPALLPVYTIVEQLGEAVPQILLALICLVNNSQCTELYNYDVFGTSMGQLIVSLFFSFGSAFIGIVKGVVGWIKFWRTRREEGKN